MTDAFRSEECEMLVMDLGEKSNSKVDGDTISATKKDIRKGGNI